MNKKSLLIIAVVLLVAVLGFMAYQQNQAPQTTGEQIEEAVEDAGQAVGEAVEDAGDAIQDAAQ